MFLSKPCAVFIFYATVGLAIYLKRPSLSFPEVKYKIKLLVFDLVAFHCKILIKKSIVSTETIATLFIFIVALTLEKQAQVLKYRHDNQDTYIKESI